jgi:nucleoside-diphosphate-sugar epimerase
MKILLTGAYGFLGSKLFNVLKEQNEILTLGTNKGDYICDLSNSQFKLNTSVDIVIHAAGKAHLTPISEAETNSFYQINVNGVNNLLVSLEKSFIPKYFIFISSVSVYGLLKGTNVSENSPLLATDPYGNSKIIAEKSIQDWCTKNEVVYTILRLPLIVSENPPGNLGAMIKAIKFGYYFNIDGGFAQKSMVLSSDVAKYILKAGEIGGVYNLTDGYHPNMHDLSKHIARQFGKSFIPNIPIKLIKLLSFIGNIFYHKFPINDQKIEKLTSTLTFDDTKARQNFGWSPFSVLKSKV